MSSIWALIKKGKWQEYCGGDPEDQKASIAEASYRVAGKAARNGQ
jgi:hypothetical protein